MRFRMLVLPALLLAVVLPAQAQARTTSLSGVVVAKQPQRGTLLLAGAHGVGVTIRGGLARTAVGERIAVRGVRLHDATIRVSRVQVLARVHGARLRGTVLRTLAHGTLLASGRSVVMIHRPGVGAALADDHRGLRPGDVAEFRLRFDDDDLFEAAPPAQVGQAATARIEGTIVSLSPLVVATEGLPLTITVPAGMTLPATLAAGQRIELTVRIGAGNVFTLVAIDEVEDAQPAAEAQEVEVKGFVTSSSTMQIVVNANGTLFTFVARAGTTLPVLPTGTFVEVRGLRQNGAITLTRLRVEDDDSGGGDDGDHGGSDGGGHDDDGGHH